MKIRFISLLTLLLVSVSAMAQNPKTLLDNASAAYTKAGGVNAVFTLNTEDTKKKLTYSHDGRAMMKGDKFKIEIPDGITWFDGKTQWVYVKGSEEVNISNPSGEELTGISPSVFLNIYKAGFKLNYKGEKKENGKTSLLVEMLPQKKGEYSKILVYLDKTTNLFNKITLFGRDGITTHLIVRKLQTGQAYNDATFTFSKKEYPDVEIVDLR